MVSATASNQQNWGAIAARPRDREDDVHRNGDRLSAMHVVQLAALVAGRISPLRRRNARRFKRQRGLCRAQPRRLRNCRRNPLHATRLDVARPRTPPGALVSSGPLAPSAALPVSTKSRGSRATPDPESQSVFGSAAMNREQVAHRPAHVFARSNARSQRLVQHYLKFSGAPSSRISRNEAAPQIRSARPVGRVALAHPTLVGYTPLGCRVFAQ
jgi:hypothetical protein